MTSPTPAPDGPGKPATKRVRVWRCPVCGSTDAGPDEDASVVDLTMMRCRGCGEGGLCDSWERDHDWSAEIELAADDDGWPARVAPLPAGDRRFLLRIFPTGGARSVQWRDAGFWIGPHD